MSNTAIVLAFDFGASSGRAIRAVYDGQNLNYEEIHRFENIPIEKDGHLCWDVETLLKEIHTAIQKAGTFDSLGFDTWGVDFGLLDADGHLLANPVHYRDARTNGKPEQAAARMPAEELYAHTGNQIMAINTLFQLLALQEQEPELLQKAAQILFMPDLFAALLGAEPVCERSIASTSQMLDPRTGQWSREVLAAYGLNANRFAPLVASGTVTGTSYRTPRRGPLRPKSSIPCTSPISRMRFTRTISRAARSGQWTLSATPSRHTADATATARSVPSPCTRAPPSSQGPGNP